MLNGWRGSLRPILSDFYALFVVFLGFFFFFDFLLTRFFRPCFLVEGKFKSSLSRFANKDQIDAPRSQSSVFQKGFNMIYCNAGPIAAGCYLSREATKSAIEALVGAITDLTTLGNPSKPQKIEIY